MRCYVPSVTNPLHIRRQRDVSEKDYKRQFHVANDLNYMLALYIGKNEKGKEKRDFELVNMIEAAKYYKASNNKESADYGIVPQKSSHNYPLAYTLKIGTMVLLYENSPEEVWNATKEELSRRLYKVIGLSSMTVSGHIYGIVILRFHKEARPSGDIKTKNGAYKQGEELRPGIVMLHSQIRALVQGRHFEINELGEIKQIEGS